jgi:predicted MFS family arabinose efflux permease
MSKQNGDKLWTSTFVALNLILLLNFCNMSVFFRFNSYLKNLGMDQSHIGLVIGLFSLAALLVRPAISPFLQPSNSKRWIFWGAACTVACLLAYNLAHDLVSLAILRLAHGSFYVLMATAAMAAFTGCIPQAKSGQAFGVVGIVALLPFALVPPLLPTLERLLGGYLEVLTVTAVPVGCIVFLLPLIETGPTEGGGGHAFNRKDFAGNLRQPAILVLLGVSLFMYTAFSTLFYYVEGFAQGLSIAMAGLYFTIATAAEIVSRFGLGPFLDRVGKNKALIISLGILSAAYLVLPLTEGAGLFFMLAAVFGLAWGVAIPSLSAQIFDLSQPRFRALNTNLGFEMMQGGYFIGPLLGGALLDGWGYGALFTACAGACLLSLGLAALGRAR